MTSPIQEKNIRRGLIALGAVALIAIAGSWLAYSVYIARSDQSIVRRVGAFLPVARVGSRVITYGEFVHARDALKAYVASAAIAQGVSPQPLTPDIEEGAYKRLLREAVVAEVSAEKGIAISDDDVNAAYNGLLTMTSSTPDALAQFIKKTFNWSEAEFRAEMLRPQLFEERVSTTLTDSTSTRDRDVAVTAYVDTRLAKPDVKEYLHFPASPLASP